VGDHTGELYIAGSTKLEAWRNRVVTVNAAVLCLLKGDHPVIAARLTVQTLRDLEADWDLYDHEAGDLSAADDGQAACALKAGLLSLLCRCYLHVRLCERWFSLSVRTDCFAPVLYSVAILARHTGQCKLASRGPPTLLLHFSCVVTVPVCRLQAIRSVFCALRLVFWLLFCICTRSHWWCSMLQRTPFSDSA
jgi:hypothetical protein